MEISWAPSRPQPACVGGKAAAARDLPGPARSRSALLAGALVALFHRRLERRSRATVWSSQGGSPGASLPPYCGRLVSPELDLLIVGVAHFDGGISGKSARKMIEDFRPSLCLVELDQQRFSRLLAHRRGLPWPYLPKRGSKFQPSPFTRSLREVLYGGLELAQSIVGNKERGGGDEFYQACLAAESTGAIVVPGDLQITNALDGLAKAIRHGFAQPVQQIAAGGHALSRALGGFARPEYDGDVASATGIAMPAALLADGGGRSLPLLRATALGFVVLNVVSFLMGGNGMDENIEGLQRMDVQGLWDVATALLGVLMALVVASSFMISFLESRDVYMASRILHVVDLVQQHEVAGMVHCRWLKSSWAAIDSEPREDGTQALPDEVVERALRVQRGTSTSSVPRLSFRPRPTDTSWMPLLTLRRPLGHGEARNFSLFEPRFLRLFDDLKEMGHAKPGLHLAVAYAPLGIERPSSLWQQRPEEAPEVPERLPPLAVEVEVMLDSNVRIVEVEDIQEGFGEDKRRRWRLTVRGTADVFPTAASQIFSDEFGALWTVPDDVAPLETPEESQGSEAKVTEVTQSRCVAVVGLMHVNSMLQQLQSKLEKRCRGESPT